MSFIRRPFIKRSFIREACFSMGGRILMRKGQAEVEIFIPILVVFLSSPMRP